MSKTKKTQKKTARREPLQLADRMVLSHVAQPDFDILADLRDGPEWRRLVGGDRRAAKIRLLGKLKKALPAELQAALRDYSDLRTIEGLEEADAAFKLGRAWERRVGGVR